MAVEPHETDMVDRTDTQRQVCRVTGRQQVLKSASLCELDLKEYSTDFAFHSYNIVGLNMDS